MNFWNQFKMKLEELFGMDERSLALLRILIGLIILADLRARSLSLVAHYTDFGVLPRHVLLDLNRNVNIFSLHLINGTAWFQAVLFCLAAFFAGMMVLGYRTRLATVVSWFLLISLQWRNPVVLQGGDIVFRCALFWMMFLPLGRRFSVDSLFDTRMREDRPQYSSMATFGFLLQIVFIYYFTAFFKTGAPWRDQGDAIYYALSIDQFAKPFGHELLRFPALLKFLSFSVWWLEAAGWLLFFSPWKTYLMRLIALCLFFSFHLGIHFTMETGLFQLIAMAVLVPFLPGRFWDAITRPLKNRGVGVRIYFDRDCGFCRRSVLILRKFLWLSGVEIFPDEVNPLVTQMMRAERSWVVEDEEGKKHFKFDAFLVLLKRSWLWHPLEPFLRIPFIFRRGTRFYEHVSGNRRNPWFPPEPAPEKPRRRSFSIVAVLTGYFIVYLFCWNMSDFHQSGVEIQPGSRWLGYLTHMDQRWDMFSPQPLVDDGWYIIPGHLRNGKTIDVFNNAQPVTYDKPQFVYKMYPDQRWQKYMMNLWMVDYSDYRLPYGQYLCREWNTTHSYEDQLLDFKIIFILERTLPNYQIPKQEPYTIWDHHCF